MTDEIIAKKSEVVEDKEVLNPKRFKDFYRLFLKEKEAMLSSD